MTSRCTLHRMGLKASKCICLTVSPEEIDERGGNFNKVEVVILNLDWKVGLLACGLLTKTVKEFTLRILGNTYLLPFDKMDRATFKLACYCN